MKPAPHAAASPSPASDSPRLALVTGASSGIGLCIARGLAQRGWPTVLLARREAELRTLAAELSRFAPSHVVPADLADPSDLERAASSLSREFPALSLLINNAGANEYAPFHARAWADHERTLRLNYTAPARLIHALLPGMLERRRGHVINIASISAKLGPWGHSTYAAAKAALASLTQTLAGEHEGRGVHFSVVFPGIVRTPYFERESYAALYRRQQSRAIPPERVAKTVLRLLDRPRLEVCIPAHFRALDLVKAISPTLAHRLVTRESRPPSSGQ